MMNCFRILGSPDFNYCFCLFRDGVKFPWTLISLYFLSWKSSLKHFAHFCRQPTKIANFWHLNNFRSNILKLPEIFFPTFLFVFKTFSKTFIFNCYLSVLFICFRNIRKITFYESFFSFSFICFWDQVWSIYKWPNIKLSSSLSNLMV